MHTSVVDQLVHMTVRIESDGHFGGGTGFIFMFRDQRRNMVPAIVTNKHVIAGADRGVFHMTIAENGRPKYGEHVRIALHNVEAGCVQHPDPEVDLAALPIAPIIQAGHENGKLLFYKAATKDLIADANFARENLNAVEDVLMIGYPNGLWDKKNNLPIVRRGVTATPPYIDFEGRPEFIIDCACFPGSSGSPVFLYNSGSYGNKQGGLSIGMRIKLLGILWGGPQYSARGAIEAVPIPTAVQQVAVSRIPNNLGFCVKAEQLLAFEEHFDRLLAADEQVRGEASLESIEEPSEAEAAE